MQSIADWLEKLGMSEYAQRFAENDIDVLVLPHLTDQSLKELGVSLGHRLKILAAVKELSGPTPAPPQPAIPTETKPQDTAERRQVTVLFSDLVGSTALAARMDPEDLREVIAAYQKSVADTVQRFGGYIAKYMGDGVLVYFGYPQAHEHDAERAVRAGLELIQAVGVLKSGASLQTRVGIATGLVVVGDLIGSGEAQERGIVGETPNLAARLQGIAEPNTVVIAEATRKLLGNLFELEDLGAKDLKGIAGLIRAFAALRPAAVESRFEALHAGGLTELVGRQEELELLIRRWSKAKTGEGQVVLLSGEAGIGKSRLTAALLEHFAKEPHTRLRYFCSPQHTDSALYPIISQMERAARLAHGDTAQAKLDKLDALLAQTSTSTQDTALFADMLSLPNDGRYPALEATSEQRRQRTLEALGSQVEALSRSTPVLMIFEDAHWSDPTSLEAFSKVVDRLRRLRVLLIVTFRPEFDPPWIGRPHVTALTLNRLAQHDIEAVIDNVVGNKLIPANIRQDIIERTDGIPLFVEEMTKAVLEAKSEGDAQQTAAAIPSPALAVPASLHASLMARLDRLGSAKEVAQIGAVIGREFSHALLAAVVRKPEAVLGSALDRLMSARLLFRQGMPPHATYLFKHTLVQDAAYGTLLRAKRIELHARIARVLDERFFDIRENNPEVLARHYTEGALAPQAIEYWQRAGNRAAKRSANQEAVAHFRRGLELLEKLSDKAGFADQELQLLIALGPSLMTTRSSASPEIGSVYARAGELARQTGRLADLFPTVWGAWLVAVSGGDLAAARRLLDQLFDIANAIKENALVLQAHHAAWTTLWAMGDLAEAREHIARGQAFYRREAHGKQALEYGSHDPSVCGCATEALIATAMGYPTHGARKIEEALRIARELDHFPTLIHALWHAGEVYQILREPRKVEEITNLALPLIAEHGSAVGLANATMLRGWAEVLLGKPEGGIGIVRDGLDSWRATGSKYQATYRLARAAEAHLNAGEIDLGLRVVGEVNHESGDIWLMPEVHRVRGELLLLSDPTNDVEDCFDRALKAARAQSARLLELRAAMSMARLWREQGKPQQARELLAAVYGWFTEGFDTLDLKEAKALLDELG
jgi:predicted ATPase/class 3 adenylate cyclase